jgi:methylphosphotriester-DNA--protein-cysteine methyltransferase
MLMVDLFECTSGSIPKDYLIEDGYRYVVSKKSKVFHKITCEQVATIKEETLIYFQSLEEAQKSGRRGCKTCKPDE